MRTPRLLISVMLICAVLGSIVSCQPAIATPPAAGEQPASAEESAATDVPASPTTAKEPVTIQWLYWRDDPSVDKNLVAEIDLFEQSHPDIKVEDIPVPWGQFTPKLQTMIAAGTPPDVICIQNEAEYVSKGFMLELDDLIKQDIDTSQYVPGAMQPAYDGHYYGLRHDTAFWLLVYNKDMLDAAGMAYPPASGWTLEQFMEAACAVSKPDEQRWGMYNLNWIHSSLVAQQGMRWLEMVDGVPQYIIDDPKAMAVYQAVGDFINKNNCQLNKDQSDSLSIGDPFITGNVAMKLDGNWAFGYLKENAKFAWDIAPVPGIKQSVGGMKIGIAKDSKKREAAWTFVKWLTYEPEATRYRSTMGMGQPAITDQEAWDTYFQSAPANLKSIVDVYSKPENVWIELDPPGKSEADGVLNPAIDEVWYATGRAEDVLPPAVKEANEILAREWEKVKP